VTPRIGGESSCWCAIACPNTLPGGAYSPNLLGGVVSAVGVGHPRGGLYPLLDKRCSHPRLIYDDG
jgi:hypothetical protein